MHQKLLPFLPDRAFIQHLPRVKAFLRVFGYALVPQYFRTHVFSDPISLPRTRSTSHLDGLRGVAALIVFNFHYLYVWGNITNVGWGGDDAHKLFIMLPVVRVVMSGRAMVYIFFAVGGYALSLNPSCLIHKNTKSDREELIRVLATSVFRRYFRLYLPVFASTLMVVFFLRLGAFEPLRLRLTAGSLYNEPHALRHNTLFNQLTYWAEEMIKMSEYNLFNWGAIYPFHDSHLWTIPFEYRASLVVYILLLGISHLRSAYGILSTVVISGYCFYCNRWEIVIYLWGSLLAQIDTWTSSSRASRQKSQLPTFDLQHLATNAETNRETRPGLSREPAAGIKCDPALLNGKFHPADIARFVLFLVSLWLLSFPTNHYDTAPGFVSLTRLLNAILPASNGFKEKVSPMLGAVLIISVLGHSSPSSVYRKLFTNELSQYLGKVSFSFYLVHGPILHMYGYNMAFMTWAIVGQDTWLKYNLGHALAWSSSLILCYCVADVFNREVEGRCIRLLSNIEKHVVRKQD